MKLKKKTLKTLSNSILKNVYGGLTTTGEEPTLTQNQKKKFESIELVKQDKP